MNKDSIIITFKKLLIYFIGGIVVNMLTIFFYSWSFCFNSQNILSGLEFSFILGLSLPYLHEYCHKKGYEYFSDSANILIQARLGTWCVIDKSLQFYNKKYMVIILLLPMILTILFGIGCEISYILNSQWFMFICLVGGLSNFLGMIFGGEYTDIKSIYLILKDTEHTKCRFVNGDTLKFQ